MSFRDTADAPGMDEDTIIHWLIQMTSLVAKLQHSKQNKKPNTDAGDDLRTYTIEDEGFSRWMGWRGPDAQEQETAWPAEELRQKRKEFSWQRFKELRDENEELLRFLRSLRDELNRRLGT